MTHRKALVAAAGLWLLAAVPCVAISQATSSNGDVVSKYDTDSDKTLDLAEVKTAASAHFDKLNKDGDSTLETKEVQGVIGPSAFKAADTDHDGTLSKPEYLALVEKLFKQADTDHDGTLSPAELQSKSGQQLRHLLD
jgi:Ca2+-binding EF-hand superfamily protein